MLVNPRLVAFLIAFFVAIITSAFLSLLKNIPTEGLFIAYIISFSSCFLLSYFLLDFLIFQEVKRIIDRFEKIKKKDFKTSKKIFSSGLNPLKKLDDDISAYALKKELEVNELKNIELYRREFIADISHELKTPIFAAQGFIDTLIEGAIDDINVRDRFLKKAASSLDGLNHLVLDLVMLSELEAGVLKMNIRPFDIVEVLNQCLEKLDKKAEERNVKIRIEKDALKSRMVMGDQSRIQQVLINLIENAVKYGDSPGKVKIKLQPFKDEVEVEIKDDGPGIGMEHQSRVFERFYRVEKSRSKEMGGSGLGLAIVKQILDAHKIQIQLESKLGKGTTFSFLLKVARESE